MNSQPEVTNETLRLVLVPQRTSGWALYPRVFGLANGMRAPNGFAALQGAGHVRALQRAANDMAWRVLA